MNGPKYWLMKAEPDSRIEKGKDVAFSVDLFERIGTSPWDGVRNPQAKKFMKEDMKLGDMVLFYHSNTKVPGVTALAEVVKEGYPDYTAWDPEHPYFDSKSNSESPKWYMVDVAFRHRTKYLVPLALYKFLAGAASVPEQLSYLTEEHLSAIKTMPLITRGRLSVQPVPALAFEATILMGERGNFDELIKSAGSLSKGKRKRADDEDPSTVPPIEEIQLPTVSQDASQDASQEISESSKKRSERPSRTRTRSKPGAPSN